jgi:hypothetical protein
MSNPQWVTETERGQVDTISSVMEAAGDKMATTHADPSNTVPHPPAPKRGKHGKPVAMARFGSASVPIYRCDSGGRVRFAISHYRDGKRMRQFFTSLDAAKKGRPVRGAANPGRHAARHRSETPRARPLRQGGRVVRPH